MVNPLRIFSVTGFYNPAAFFYFFLRVLLRILLRRRNRDKILKMVNLETLENFLKKLRFPGYLSYVLMVKETKARIKSPLFRYEQKVSSFIIKKKGSVFVDIGANVGYYSFLLCDNFETILAVEPHPNNIRILETLKSRHNYSKVKVCPFAIGDKDNARVKLYIGAQCGGHSLLTYNSLLPYNGQNRKYIETRLVTLHTLLKDYPKVDLIKVDVEGAEWFVLKGAEPFLDKIQSWIIELHNWKKRKELEEWFRSRNYTYRWLDVNHIYAERSE